MSVALALRPLRHQMGVLAPSIGIDSLSPQLIGGSDDLLMLVRAVTVFGNDLRLPASRQLFEPVPIRGEPLSTTILRERR